MKSSSVSINEDCELIQRCQNGEVRAQLEFYKQYRTNVTRMVYSVLGNSPDLEDTVQDTFIEVFRAIRSFRNESKITTWLWRISRNVALQRLRHMKSKPEGHLTDCDKEAYHNESPLRILERKDASHRVDQLLNSLSPKKKKVFILHEVVGMNANEIAEIVGMNPMTVRSCLHYARKEFAVNCANSLEELT